MTTLIRDREHEPYRLLGYLAPAKKEPWQAAKEIASMLLIFVLIGGLFYLDPIAEWLGGILK
jgi:hypothetical protein